VPHESAVSSCTALLLRSVARLDAWKHCPRCTAPLRHEHGRVECGECGFVEYANSKPTASAVIVDDAGRVMLSKRAIDPHAGKWDLPGGFVEEGEHPVECMHRELREEAGVGLKDTEFIGVFMDWYDTGQGEVSTLNLYWSARIADGTPEPRDDVEELRFFAPDEIQPGELAFAHLPDVLSALRRRNEHA
jgi:ADP-ribose pyrophosphatase YjhB (NUDIX family)